MATVVRLPRRRGALTGLTKGLDSITNALKERRRRETLAKLVDTMDIDDPDGVLNDASTGLDLNMLLQIAQIQRLDDVQVTGRDAEGNEVPAIVDRDELVATGQSEDFTLGTPTEASFSKVKAHRTLEDGSVQEIEVEVPTELARNGELSKRFTNKGFRFGAAPEKAEVDQVPFYQDAPIINPVGLGPLSERGEGTLTFEEWKAKYGGADGPSTTESERQAARMVEDAGLVGEPGAFTRAFTFVKHQNASVERITAHFNEKKEDTFIFTEKGGQLAQLASSILKGIVMEPRKFGLDPTIGIQTAERKAIELAESILGPLETRTLAEQEDDLSFIPSDDSLSLIEDFKRLASNEETSIEQEQQHLKQVMSNPDIVRRIQRFDKEKDYMAIRAMLMEEGVDPKLATDFALDMLNQAKQEAP